MLSTLLKLIVLHATFDVTESTWGLYGNGFQNHKTFNNNNNERTFGTGSLLKQPIFSNRNFNTWNNGKGSDSKDSSSSSNAGGFGIFKRPTNTNNNWSSWRNIQGIGGRTSDSKDSSRSRKFAGSLFKRPAVDGHDKNSASNKDGSEDTNDNKSTKTSKGDVALNKSSFLRSWNSWTNNGNVDKTSGSKDRKSRISSSKSKLSSKSKKSSHSKPSSKEHFDKSKSDVVLNKSSFVKNWNGWTNNGNNDGESRSKESKSRISSSKSKLSNKSKKSSHSKPSSKGHFDKSKSDDLNKSSFLKSWNGWTNNGNNDAESGSKERKSRISSSKSKSNSKSGKSSHSKSSSNDHSDTSKSKSRKSSHSKSSSVGRIDRSKSLSSKNNESHKSKQLSEDSAAGSKTKSKSHGFPWAIKSKSQGFPWPKKSLSNKFPWPKKSSNNDKSWLKKSIESKGKSQSSTETLTKVSVTKSKDVTEYKTIEKEVTEPLSDEKEVTERTTEKEVTNEKEITEPSTLSREVTKSVTTDKEITETLSVEPTTTKKEATAAPTTAEKDVTEPVTEKSTQTIQEREDLPAFGPTLRPPYKIPKICQKPTPPCCVGGELTVNLNNGKNSRRQVVDGITLLGVSKGQGRNKKQACSSTALVMVDFEKIDSTGCFGCLQAPYCGKRMLKIQLHLSNARRGGWLFNVGDSESNNGYRGDDNDQMNDAETQGLFPNITVYPSDKCPSVSSLMHIIDALGHSVDTVTLYISNEHIRITNNNGLDFKLCHTCLYALNGQPDAGPNGIPNETICIGLNRVVKDITRSGYGVCSATFSWECPWCT